MAEPESSFLAARGDVLLHGRYQDTTIRRRPRDLFEDCQRSNKNGPLAKPFFQDAGLDRNHWGDPELVPQGPVRPTFPESGLLLLPAAHPVGRTEDGPK